MPNSYSRTSSSKASVDSMELYAERGIPSLCYCGLGATVLTSPADGYPARKFFGCPIREDGGCNMKKCWDEAVIEELSYLDAELDDLKGRVKYFSTDDKGGYVNPPVMWCNVLQARAEIVQLLELARVGGQDYNELKTMVLKVKEQSRADLAQLLELARVGGHDYNELKTMVLKLQGTYGVCFRIVPYEELLVLFVVGATLAFLMIISFIILVN